MKNDLKTGFATRTQGRRILALLLACALVFGLLPEWTLPVSATEQEMEQDEAPVTEEADPESPIEELAEEPSAQEAAEEPPTQEAAEEPPTQEATEEPPAQEESEKSPAQESLTAELEPEELVPEASAELEPEEPATKRDDPEPATQVPSEPGEEEPVQIQELAEEEVVTEAAFGAGQITTIASVSDWNAFVAAVNSGNTFAGQTVTMSADVGVVTDMIQVGKTFNGVFDGGNHTLTVNFQYGDVRGAALFPYVASGSITVKNLKLAGTINGGIHAAGVIGEVAESAGSTMSIDNVAVYASIQGGSYLGGFLGHAGGGGSFTVTNSQFLGSIRSNTGTANFIGGFAGWGGRTKWTFRNCQFGGQYGSTTYFNAVGFYYGPEGNNGVTVEGFASNSANVGSGDSNGRPLYTSTYDQWGEAVAQVGVIQYDNLSAALSAWADGTTLTLLDDVTTASTITVSGTRTLDLNGHGIRRTGSGSMLQVGSGAKLTINDSNPSASHSYTVSNAAGNGAGLATVYASDSTGSQKFTGGYITGGNSNQGGGILVDGGNLVLNDGTIIGNHASSNAGGIRVINNGSFTMNDGAILANSTNSFGGGISVGGKGSVTINGGTIRHNWSGANGGAIHTDAGGGSGITVRISGGEIIDNHTNATDKVYGGGVLRANGTSLFISGNPVIKGNTKGASGTAANNIHLVQSKGETIQISGALGSDAEIGISLVNSNGDPVTGVFTSGSTTYNDAQKFFSDAGQYIGRDKNGQLVIFQQPAAQIGSEQFADLEAALSAWTDGTTLTLLDDVTTANTITVSGTRNLDLNGHGIRMTGSGSVISVPAGTGLTLTDSAPDAEHRCSIASPVPNGAGLAAVDDANGDKTFTGGYITGGNASYGGGIYVEGSLTMNGGTIIGNQAGDTGAGVFAAGGSTVSMTGGALIHNSSTYGGGIGSTRPGSGVTSISLTGGTIAYNKTTGTGGGVHTNANGGNLGSSEIHLTIAGSVRIENNHTNGTWSNHANAGGGVVIDGAGDRFELSGSPVIAGNTAGEGTSGYPYVDNNIFFNNRGNPKVVVGALTVSTPIGVTMRTMGVFTNGIGSTGSVDSLFASDNPALAVTLNTNGEAQLVYIRTLTFNANGHGTAPEAQAVPNGCKAKEPDALTEMAWTFGGWYREANCDTAWNFDTDTVNGDMTLYAKWTINRYTITFDTQGGTAVEPITQDYDTAVTAPAKPTRTGYTFDGWDREIPETMPAENVTITAAWTLNTYQITFDANGGSGAMAGQTGSHGIPCQLQKNLFARGRYVFAGWNTEAGGGGTAYADETSITLTGPVILYAQWQVDTSNSIVGTVVQNGQVLGGATVTLMQGDETVAVSTTNAGGVYSFAVEDGLYNIVVEKDGVTRTQLVDLSGTEDLDITLPVESITSRVAVEGTSTPDIMVGGLDVLAEQLSAEHPGSAVAVTMSVEQTESVDTDVASAIGALAPYQTLAFFDITVAQQIGDAEAVELSDTGEILEIIVPFTFSNGKQDVAVYRYHNGQPERLTESGSKLDGTCRLDRTNGRIYIYTNRFSIYSIGFTQCYNISGPVRYGNYTGSVTLSLLDSAQENVVRMDEVFLNDGSGEYSFSHISRGDYYLRAVWTENGEQVTLTKALTVE